MSTKTLNTKQAMAAFGVSHVTLFNWRRGTATRDPLPCVQDPEAWGRATIAFKPVDLKRWAKRYGLEFAIQPDAILANPALVEAPAKQLRMSKKTPTAKKLAKSNPSKRERARTAKKPS